MLVIITAFLMVSVAVIGAVVFALILATFLIVSVAVVNALVFVLIIAGILIVSVAIVFDFVFVLIIAGILMVSISVVVALIFVLIISFVFMVGVSIVFVVINILFVVISVACSSLALSCCFNHVDNRVSILDTHETSSCLLILAGVIPIMVALNDIEKSWGHVACEEAVLLEAVICRSNLLNLRESKEIDLHQAVSVALLVAINMSRANCCQNSCNECLFH